MNRDILNIINKYSILTLEDLRYELLHIEAQINIYTKSIEFLRQDNYLERNIDDKSLFLRWKYNSISADKIKEFVNIKQKLKSLRKQEIRIHKSIYKLLNLNYKEE